MIVHLEHLDEFKIFVVKTYGVAIRIAPKESMEIFRFMLGDVLFIGRCHDNSTEEADTFEVICAHMDKTKAEGLFESWGGYLSILLMEHHNAGNEPVDSE